MKKESNAEIYNNNISVVFLGAGLPLSGDTHPVLRETLEGSRVLDWLLQAYPARIKKRQFIGGYRFDELVKQYQDLDYIENPEWVDTGAVGSLFMAELPANGLLIVSYSDILYRADTVQSLLSADGDIVTAVDTSWKDRYQGRSEEDLINCEKVHLAGNKVTRLGSDLDPRFAGAEFIGLVCFRESALSYLRRTLKVGPKELKKENISGLVEWLRIEGLNVKAIDVKGDWAELDDPRDLARFVLGTKAQTLERLQGLVRKSLIEDQVTFTVADWQLERNEVIDKIQKLFTNKTVAVRSSAINEDNFTSANAGVFKTLLDIPAGDKKKLKAAIDDVAASFSDGNRANQVLVQPMVETVRASGVAFTRTLEYGAPYYVINYDDSTGTTFSVTAGSGEEQKVLLVRRDYKYDRNLIPDFLKGLLPAMQEIENLVGYDALDIEFAINDDNLVHIFQVRPITIDHAKWEIKDADVFSQIKEAETSLQRLQKNSPFVMGKKAIFGVMPDWNPAEIIGTNPGLLSASIYQFLIMDEIWATQRAEYGYRDVRPLPLMVSFVNRPFVDIRASANSFVPAPLDDQLTARLVDFYIDWLKRFPHLHDKFEFEVVPTCYSLDFDRWEKRLEQEGGFKKKEIACLKDELKKITVRALTRNNSEFKSIAKLEKRFEKIRDYELDPLDKAYLLLLDCRVYGTLPFSHLARSAFIAVTLLKSAVCKNIIDQEVMDDFLNSLQTVGKEFALDALKTTKGEIDYNYFLKRYGHLRPGTYDITVASYAEDPEYYLRPILEQAEKGKIKPDQQCGELWKKERTAFFKALAAKGICMDGEKVETFMRGAIEGREYAKFAFTRNLSVALDCIVAYGENNSIERADLAHISIDDLLSLRLGGAPDVAGVSRWLNRRAADNKKLHRLGAAVELPPLLTGSSDFSVFSYLPDQANYIGGKAVTGPCFNLAGNEGKTLNLTGVIVMIPQADPGYDWLFGQGIAGLITMYGGANSHMAIRAAEFGLPAAIGIGEIKYKRLSTASLIELNAEKKWLKVVR